MALEICPVTFRQANAFVKDHHRHSGTVTGGKFWRGERQKNRKSGKTDSEMKVRWSKDLQPGKEKSCPDHHKRTATIMNIPVPV